MTKILTISCLTILLILVVTSCKNQTGPLGIPVFAGASIEVIEERKLIYTTSQSIDEVAAFYQVKMSEIGWTYDSATTVLENNRTIVVYMYFRDDAEVEIAFSEQEGETFVSILVISAP